MNRTTVSLACQWVARMGAVLVIPLGALAPGSAQAADDVVKASVGVTAGGVIDYAFRTCSTCSVPTGVVDADTKDHRGSRGPVIVSLYGTMGTGVGDTYARSLIVGSNAEPGLSAKAYAVPGIGTHDGFSGQGVYQMGASAFATATQHYTYTGANAEDYVIGYSLSGRAGSFAPSPQPADDAAIQVGGGLSIFDGKDPNIELPLGGLVDISQRSVNGSAGTFRENGAVAIKVNPGDSFYLQAFLSANVSVGGWGQADASNSLDVEFTAGDTRLLVPFLTPVPEPSAYALMGLGLAVMLLAARRHRARG